MEFPKEVRLKILQLFNCACLEISIQIKKKFFGEMHLTDSGNFLEMFFQGFFRAIFPKNFLNACLRRIHTIFDREILPKLLSTVYFRFISRKF